jgi:hypothetical protein
MDEPTMKTTSINVRVNFKRLPAKISECGGLRIHASAELKFYELFLSSPPLSLSSAEGKDIL